MGDDHTKQPMHIALLPGVGLGHLFPFSVLARQLIHHHNISVTIITQSLYSPSSTEQSLIDALQGEMNVVSIPPPPENIINPNMRQLSLILFILNHNLPQLRAILGSLAISTQPLRAIVLDMFFGEKTLDVAKEFGVQPYIFFSSPCRFLSFCFHLPALDETYAGEYKDITEPITLHGCVQLSGNDVPEPALERKSESYAEFLRHVSCYHEAKGILVNSFEDLEPSVVKGMKEDKNIPPIYLVGPLTRTRDQDCADQCLKWMDEQPKGSVLYVSFGSGGTLTTEQMKELAWGLELSQQRFLWVIKKPNESKASASYFGWSKDMGNLDFLPDGFLDRTKDLGLVVFSWAPQVEVLHHASTGGCISHCGWNSTLESIVSGVPLIVWPLFAEQKMNARMLVDDVMVGLEPVRDGETSVVRREEIARVIKCLMEEEEGKRVRDRMRIISEKAAHTVEEGGFSLRSMEVVVSEWKALSYE